MRLNVPRTAAVHPDTRRSDFVRQVAALFDSFCQSAATMKCHPEEFHFHSMAWKRNESVVQRPLLTHHTNKNQSTRDGGLQMKPDMNGLFTPTLTPRLRAGWDAHGGGKEGVSKVSSRV